MNLEFAICSHHEYTSALNAVCEAHCREGAKLLPNALRLAVVKPRLQSHDPPDEISSFSFIYFFVCGPSCFARYCAVFQLNWDF